MLASQVGESCGIRRRLVGTELALIAERTLAVVEEYLVLARPVASVGDDKVQITRRTSDEAEALVSSGDVSHRVSLSAEQTKCTCPWHAKHQGQRGPCKHILSVRMVLEEGKHE